MALPIRDVIGILADNLDRRGSVIPLSMRQTTGWADGLKIPFGGETVIYTGLMYQLIPSIEALAGWMEKFEGSWISRFIGLGRAVNRVINLSWFLLAGRPEEQKKYDGMLHDIARLLMTAGVKFGYLYGKELYSGALLYDEGVDDVFVRHARRVYRIFKDNGVKHVITLDPHTTDMLKTVYPKFISGYDLEVKSYLEVLAERDLQCASKLDGDVVIHDSCVYARYDGIIDQPRSLLANAGLKLPEPELSGRLTHCCGGPLESLFPGKARQVASKRAGQLAECGQQVVAMCPICLANLKRAADSSVEISDISRFLARAYCPMD